MNTAFIQTTLHTPIVDSHVGDLDLRSSGEIAISLPGASRAISTTATASETTVSSLTKGLEFRSGNMDLTSSTAEHFAGTSWTYRSGDEAGTSSHVSGTRTSLTVGTGAADMSTGAFLAMDKDKSVLSGGGSSIMTGGGKIQLRSNRHDMTIGGVNILSVRDNKVAITRDIDVQGTLNTIDASINALRIRDPNVMLAYDSRTDSAISDRATGMAIQTVPGAAIDLPYMTGFKDANGAPIFVADNAVDVHKSELSGAFHKHVAYSVRSGSKVLGKRTTPARILEPTWDFAGGGIRLSRTVPGAGNGEATRYSVRLRVTDTGDFEVIRETLPLVWNASAGHFSETNQGGVLDILQTALVV